MEIGGPGLTGRGAFLAKAPVLLRADARADERCGGQKRRGQLRAHEMQLRSETIAGIVIHLVMRARSSGVESVSDRTFCERAIARYSPEMIVVNKN